MMQFSSSASRLRATWGTNVKRCHPSLLEPAEPPRGRWRRGAIALVSAAAVVAAAGLSPSGADARVLLVGSWHGHHGSFKTIQAAVDSAKSGDWILVGPGDYHERGDRDRRYRSLAEHGAGVMITTPRIHVRGMDRSRVVVDGTKPGASRCSRAASDQDFGPRVGGKANGRNGVEVFKASGVSVENLTACNFLEGEGSSGNQIWFDFGDGSGRSIPGAFRGAYLNATSTYYATGKPAASYGIFSSNSRGPGTFTHTYASNMNDSSYYIGACSDCNQVLTNAHAQYSALGYSGTNAGGHLIVENSEWDHNQSGIVTNSQNNDDAPSPQLGLCPGSTSRSCTFFRNNYVHDNNNANVPSAGSAALGPVGSGIIVSGGRFDTVTGNRVVNNGSWGIMLVPFPDLDTPPPIAHCEGGTTHGPLPGCYYDDWANTVSHNTFTHNGFFGNPTNGDAADISAQNTPGNCWFGNVNTNGTPITSEPPDIQSTHGTCGVPNQGAGPTQHVGPAADLRQPAPGPVRAVARDGLSADHAGRDAAPSARPAHDARSLPRGSAERVLHAHAALHRVASGRERGRGAPFGCIRTLRRSCRAPIARFRFPPGNEHVVGRGRATALDDARASEGPTGSRPLAHEESRSPASRARDSCPSSNAVV